MRQIFKLSMAALLSVILLVGLAGCGGSEPPAPETPSAPETPVTPEKPEEPEKPAEPEKPTEPEKPAVLVPDEPTMAATIFGEAVKIGVDADGALREDYTITTPDGSTSLLIKAGATLKDRDGKNIPELMVEVNADPEQPEDGSRVVGPTLTCYPDLTAIKPPLEYQINYAAFKDSVAAVPDA